MKLDTVILLVPVIGFMATVSVADAPDSNPHVSLTKLEDRVRVEIDGQLFTEYLFKDASRPYCYPVLASDGTSLTRDFPMKETPGEDTDHKHQRALMFAHSDVNEIDFWNEGTSGTPFPKGSVVHAEIIKATSGDVGFLRTSNRWIAPDGTLMATDETTLRFHGTADSRMLDHEVSLHALPDRPLVMGDNKDGTMAIRVPQWMTLPHRNQVSAGNGHIVTATGQRDDAAWGTRAEWCDYFGEHDGRTYGIAIFDHPENLRHPTWWMARNYGLLAANPFGQRDFEPDRNHADDKGDYTISAGGRLTLRYRFYFHKGDEKEGKVAERYEDYAAGR